MTIRDEDIEVLDEELDFRETARSNLTTFSEHIMPNYRESKFMRLMDEKLEKVVQYIETGGKKGIGRLMIYAPPRHFKSWKVARILPAFFLGRNPDKHVILTSYGSELVISHSKIVRGFVKSPQFQQLWGKNSLEDIDLEGNVVEISSDSKKMDLWQVAEHGGTMLAAGVGGALTGWGCHLAIIDDPYRGRKEAESPTIRNSALEFYDNTFYSRLEPGAAVVVIMQRWRKDDLCGILNMRSDPNSEYYMPGYDKFEVLNLPAIAEKGDVLGRKEGEPLWPEDKNLDYLNQKRVNMGTYGWLSQYQQRPTDPEGSIMKKDWFPLEHVPPLDWGIMVWDCAMKEGQENDYWVGMLLCPVPGGIIIPEIVRKQMDYPEGKRHIVGFYNNWNQKGRCKVRQVRIEDKVTGTPMVQQLGADTRIPVVGYKPQGDKEYRLRSIAPYAESRRIALNIEGEWVKDFLEEVCSFPYGDHDDICDVLSEGVAYLAGAGGFQPGKKEKENKTKRDKLFGKKKKARAAIRRSPLS